jgi:DNA modification methylase
MKLYYETDCGKLYYGDVLDILKDLPAKSVNCCVTSPPYWGLRDYGAKGQLGLEKTPEEYVEKMVAVFDEVKQVLRDDGTVWLNLGDSYSSGGRGCNERNNNFLGKGTGKAMSLGPKKAPDGLKPKDLVGIPWRVAFALQAAGWYLRQDIIWHKPNPMPESVKDRCTKAHEYIFLLSKSKKYFCDMESVKETAEYPNGPNSPQSINSPYGQGFTRKNNAYSFDRRKTRRTKPTQRDRDHVKYSGKRNKRSVWTVSTKPFSGAHFAVFPPALIEPCIMAGCPKGGTVIDPFMGSGTTAIVAHKNDRKFVGIEINKKYIDEITIPRIESETRQLKLF